jgi:hypothetical protein
MVAGRRKRPTQEPVPSSVDYTGRAEAEPLSEAADLGVAAYTTERTPCQLCWRKDHWVADLTKNKELFVLDEETRAHIQTLLQQRHGTRVA